MSDCLFCRIARKEIPASIVYEDDEILAFKDINPSAPVHILIIPNKHLAGLYEMGEDDISLVGRINLIAKKIADEQGIGESGYRLVTNCLADSGQQVPHLHYHLIGGCFLGSFCRTEN